MSGPPRYDGALREIQSPTGLHYRIHETPEDLAGLTPRVAQELEIWIDTETADWNTKSPRLSLVHGATPEMAAAYHTTFAPRVIAAPRITKWAHYARFERRILGADFVQGLHCTFDLARRVPYHPPPAAEPAAGRARPSSLRHRGRQDLAARGLGPAAAERGAARVRGLGPRMVRSGARRDDRLGPCDPPLRRARSACRAFTVSRAAPMRRSGPEGFRSRS